MSRPQNLSETVGMEGKSETACTHPRYKDLTQIDDPSSAGVRAADHGSSNFHSVNLPTTPMRGSITINGIIANMNTAISAIKEVIGPSDSFLGEHIVTIICNMTGINRRRIVDALFLTKKRGFGFLDNDTRNKEELEKKNPVRRGKKKQLEFDFDENEGENNDDREKKKTVRRARKKQSHTEGGEPGPSTETVKISRNGKLDNSGSSVNYTYISDDPNQLLRIVLLFPKAIFSISDLIADSQNLSLVFSVNRIIKLFEEFCNTGFIKRVGTAGLYLKETRWENLAKLREFDVEPVDYMRIMMTYENESLFEQIHKHDVSSHLSFQAGFQDDIQHLCILATIQCPAREFSIDLLSVKNRALRPSCIQKLIANRFIKVNYVYGKDGYDRNYTKQNDYSVIRNELIKFGIDSDIYSELENYRCRVEEVVVTSKFEEMANTFGDGTCPENSLTFTKNQITDVSCVNFDVKTEIGESGIDDVEHVKVEPEDVYIKQEVD